MKRLLLVLLCWLVSAPVWAAPSVRQYQLDAATTPWATDGIAEVTFGSDFVPGNTVCVGFGMEVSSRTVSSVQDDGGPTNTYTLPTTATAEVAGNVEGWIYCSVIARAANVVTVTISSATTAPGRIFGVEFENAAATAPTVGAAATITAGAGPHTSGTLTITGSGPTLWGFSLAIGSEVWTIDPDYTEQSNTSTLVVGWNQVTASEAMANTTSSSATTVTVLVEVVEAAGGAQTFGFRRRLQVNP